MSGGLIKRCNNSGGTGISHTQKAVDHRLGQVPCGAAFALEGALRTAAPTRLPAPGTGQTFADPGDHGGPSHRGEAGPAGLAPSGESGPVGERPGKASYMNCDGTQACR